MSRESVHKRSLRDPNGKFSSLRYNVRLVVISVNLMMLAVTGYIVNATVNYNSLEPRLDFMGVAAFLGACASVLVGVLYNQQLHKKTEKENPVGTDIHNNDQR